MLLSYFLKCKCPISPAHSGQGALSQLQIPTSQEDLHPENQIISCLPLKGGFYICGVLNSWPGGIQARTDPCRGYPNCCWVGVEVTVLAASWQAQASSREICSAREAGEAMSGLHGGWQHLADTGYVIVFSLITSSWGPYQFNLHAQWLGLFHPCCQAPSPASTAAVCAWVLLLGLLLPRVVGTVGTVGAVTRGPEHWGITTWPPPQHRAGLQG